MVLTVQHIAAYIVYCAINSNSSWVVAEFCNFHTVFLENMTVAGDECAVGYIATLACSADSVWHTSYIEWTDEGGKTISTG